MRGFVVPRRSWVTAFALALILLFVLPGAGRAENHKHHLGFALGYEKHLSDDLKDESNGIDYTDAGYGAVAYRLSVLSNLDVTLDARGTTHSDNIGGVDLTLSTGFFGPGLRLISPNEGLRPYVQANFFLVSESVESEQAGVKISEDESGVGFGISSGVDIRLSNLLALPIEMNYMYGKPADDISGIGANVGLTFNFGHLK
jgi:outer membrane protein with beta-barrel domain